MTILRFNYLRFYLTPRWSCSLSTCTSASPSISSTVSQQLKFDSAVDRRRISKLLIANRGEIACRVIRTARRMGIETVAVFSDADRHSMHVTMADEAYHIGPSPATESYLVKQKLIDVALRSGAQAIHPGYGFLSENFEFATECMSVGVKFVGPSPDAIKSMGIKSLSKSIMIEANVPVIPGFHDDAIQEDDALLAEARRIGFPLMIKAVRGGGGKGMRIAATEADFLDSLHSARREALKAFGDQVVLLERFVRRPRHVEVQVFGDAHGNCVHLFERDCSSQRRHQKVIEEAPAPHITSQIRAQIGEAAVRAAKAVRYEGAGTVEFIYDTSEGKFYFMEMNTRLQVEHPVTELITGLDLVEWQLRIASGEPLPRAQSHFSEPHGHAFEARIYAEDADANFMPCTGLIERLVTPKMDPNISGDIEKIRVETGVSAGDQVSVFYDPMIAKLVVWSGVDRRSALAGLRRALGEFRIAGLKTNVDYLRRLASHPVFESGDIYTDFIAEHSDQLRPKEIDASERDCLHAVAALSIMFRENAQLRNRNSNSDDRNSPFSANDSNQPRFLLLTEIGQTRILSLQCRLSGAEICSSVRVTPIVGDDPAAYSIQIGENEAFVVKLDRYDSQSGQMDLIFGSCSTLSPSAPYRRRWHVLTHGEDRMATIYSDHFGTITFELQLPASLQSSEASTLSNSSSTFDGRDIRSPMPALVEKIMLQAGDCVRHGDTIAILTAMKMETVIRATFADPAETRTVEQVFCRSGDSVAKGAKLVRFTQIDANQ